jgi:hypothetical protein
MAVVSKVPNKPAAAGVTSPAAVVLVWILGEYGVELPPEVAAAVVSLLTALAYWAVPSSE